MNQVAFNLAGLHVTWAMLAVTIGLMQWIAFAILSARTRQRFPKKGLRRSEQLLLGSSAVLFLSWLAQVDFTSATKPKVEAAAVVSARTPKGSCASIGVGMTKADVLSKLGEPDEIRPDDETRGPGAALLIYRASRCSVHVFDERVEFID